MLELAHDAILVRDAEARIIYWNRGAEETYGWTPEEAAGQVTHRLFQTKFPTTLPEIEAELERSGRWSGELVHRRKDGGIAIVESRWAVQKAGGGRRVLEINRDVTARKRAEQATEDERRLLRVMLASMDDGVTLQDQAGNAVFANESASRLLGIPSPEGLAAAPLSEVMQRFEAISGAGSPLPADAWPDRAVLDGRATSGTALLRRRAPGTGDDRWLSVRADPVTDSAGRVVQALSVFRNVTAERQEEDRRRFLLRAVEELSSSLDYEMTLATVARLAVPVLADWCTVDIVEAGRAKRVATAHIDPTKVAILDELARRYPRDPESDIGVPKVVRTGKPQMIPDLAREVMIETVAVDEEHLKLIDRLQACSYMGIPIRVRGRTIGAVGLAMAESRRRYSEADLTLASTLADRAALAIENARLFREVERARAATTIELTAETRRRHEAEEASRFAEMFVGILGHDLRNPLNAVTMTAKLLRRRGSVDDAALGRILSSAQRMSNMVTQLLDLTRSRLAGGITVDPKPTDLAAVVTEVVDEVRRAHPGQDIRLETVGDGRALIDRDRLAQVVSNLLGNAVEHGDRSRPVTVELAANGDAVGLLVHNAGSPIPPELLPVIFDPFRRTGGPDKRSRGLGLGLFISQQIVLAHRGRIDVRSTVELGTTFTVTLPRLAIEKLASPDGHLVA